MLVCGRAAQELVELSRSCCSCSGWPGSECCLARGGGGQRKWPDTMKGGNEVAATETAELPGAPKASGEPAAGGHALAVRAAARLSVELALAALVPLAAACAFELATTQLISGPASGAWWTAPFFGVDYVHREAVIMYQEPDSIPRRHRETNVACLVATFVLTCSWPLAYMQYLGASRRAFGAMVCVIALSYSFLELGCVVLGVRIFLDYLPVIGFMWLYAALRVLCPSGSAVPRQALRQLAVISIGNVLVMNVAQPRNVGGWIAESP